MPRKHFSHYLYFTGKDRRGSLVVLVVIVMLCMLPFAYPLFSPADVTETNTYDEQLAELKSQQTDNNKKYTSNSYDDERRPYDHPNTLKYSTAGKGQLFYFDPNTISENGWKKLGLRDKTIATILNYRNKGGRFKKAEDIKKIWGLFPDEAERLIPFVNIAESNEAYPERNAQTAYEREQPVYEKKKSLEVVDINASDTSAWIALPGIGTKLSQRIINFRNKLGGFYKVEQVGETYGLADSVFQKIKPFLLASEVIAKININTATLDELKMHPYINYQLANAIVQYRNQHGEYNNLEDIRKIMLVDETVFSKLAPYLSVK